MCRKEVALDLRRADEALALGEEAILLREGALGRDHPEVAATLCNIAGARFALGDGGGARRAVARAWGVAKGLPESHPLVQAIHRLREAIGGS